MKKYYIILEYILRFIASTWRINKSKALPGIPCIIAFWHGQMLPVWKLFANQKACAVVSLNKDGAILAHLLTKWKYKLVRGSSSNKGKEIITEIVNNSEQTYFLITPDGPRGPRQQCKAGAFVIAKQKQIPVYFLTCNICKKKTFNKSWDKFELPLPFSKININISDPIHIHTDSSKEAINALMNACNEKFLS